jgi:hypothetical protein
MRARGLVAWVAGLVVVSAAAVACASVESRSPLEERPDGSTTNPGSSGGVADAAPAPLQPLRGDGVMLVHAAEFPPLRICFEGRPGAKPIPDAHTMPDANIVGLDIGTGIRLPPIRQTDKLGKVFVIEVDPSRIRSGFDENATCGELICEVGSGPQCLTAGRDYAVSPTEIDAPQLGVDRLTVLAVKGCGNGFQIGQLGVDSAECGASWDILAGNVSVQRIENLELSTRAPGVLPVQLVNLSARLSPALGNLEVRYGPLSPVLADGGADAGASALEEVATNPPLDVVSAARKLTLPDGDETVYGTRGFVIERKTGSGNAFSVSASLAEVQESSSPLSLPGDYYKSASNYALLLLGDPRAQAANDPRRVHLIAVPMTEPSDPSDAGADDAGSADR